MAGWRRLDWLAAGALGALQTVACFETRAWALPFVCIAALVALLAAARPRRAFGLGLAFGTAWLVAGTWWLFISMHRYGGLPAWMAGAAVLGLSAFLSLYLAAACGLWARWRRGRPLVDALLFAALWLLAELARGIIFTGFPWTASGYSQVDGPLAALAPYVGVYGIGFVIALLAAWPATGRRAGQGVAAGVAVAVLLALWAMPAHRFSLPNGTLGVTLLQGNIPQDEKFDNEFRDAALDWHVAALTEATTDLVVGPETAVPFLPEELPENFWPALKAHFATGRVHALFGVPLGNETEGYTNSAVGFGPDEPEYRYAKHHLVPFGEFVPTGFRWFTRLMNIPLGDFNRGAVEQPSFVVGRQRVAPNICYEDLFGEDLAARFTDPAAAPTIFANISNIGWFGDTIAVAQHLNISRMRSLEFERPMIRSTNTGATAIVDDRGVVRHELAPYTRGVLVGEVEGRTGTTPFAWWAGRLYVWPLVALALALVVACGRRGPRP